MASRNNHIDDADKTALALARASRIRAARAFAGLDQADFASALGVSVVTVKRMEKGTRETSLDDLRLLADLCKVPHEFMEEGFAAMGSGKSNTAVVDELRAAFVEILDARMADLTEALLTRDEAMATSRQAIERLRNRAVHQGNDDD